MIEHFEHGCVAVPSNLRQGQVPVSKMPLNSPQLSEIFFPEYYWSAPHQPERHGDNGLRLWEASRGIVRQM